MADNVCDEDADDDDDGVVELVEVIAVTAV